MANKKRDKNSDNNDISKDPVKRPEKGIVPKQITSEMKEAYLDYAMSVIVQRALPDIRDGLKPVHRRILFSMNQLGLSSGSGFRKSALIVGDVIGKFHPHGETAVYESMVKMAQDFSFRYPLVVGQGNFGSIDGDSAAAYRYTEAKMSKIAGELLQDLDKNTVDFRPNYDGSRNEPMVLPSAVPNLLLNGTMGIAVGMATNIPPHNLREVVDATVYLIENKDATGEDLLQFIKGPDFPTGGIIFGQKDIHHAYSTGRGGVVCRGEAEIVETKSGNFQIIITSIPYRVNKSDMIMKIADLVRDKKLEGIKDMRDESTKDIRVVIDLKNGTFPKKVLNYIYKHTSLEDVFHFNMVALVDGVPQTLSLKTILEQFIAHRQIVVMRRAQFELDKAEAREHILLGLKKALDHIDEIIKLIKSSRDVTEAHAALMKKFKFSDKQSTAILEMRLQKLAGLERKKIEDELVELQKVISELKALLASPNKILRVIKKELAEVSERYGDDRRTRVVKGEASLISAEDLVPEEESVLIMTRGGYVKRTNPNEFRMQRRGGVGVVDLNTKEEDFVTHFITASTLNDLLFFSDKGKAYKIKMYEIPEGRRATKGKSIMNFLSLEGGERINSILPMPKDVKNIDFSIIILTKKGIVKKVSGASFHDVRRSGLIAIKLSGDDELISTRFVKKGDDVILATTNGQAIRFKEGDAREMGRSAGGVRAVRLSGGDMVVGADVIGSGEKDAALLSISQKGFGKKTPLKEYKVQKRGGSGIKTAKLTSKTGKLIASMVISENETEVIAISKKSQVIRLEVKEIPALGRQTQGVRIMKLREGDSIASTIIL